MGKKQTMSLAEVTAKFGGDPLAGVLPSSSTGEEFKKGYGKGKYDRDDNRGDGDLRNFGGKRGGKGKDREDSRADTGDWFSRDRPAGDSGGNSFGDRRGGDRGGDRPGRDNRRDDNSRADTGDWFSKDKPGAGGSSFGDRRGQGRDGGRDGGAPSERPRLQLKPRSVPTDGKEAPARASDDKDADAGEDDGFTTVKNSGASKPAGNKYVPPSMRKKMEEEDDSRRKQDEEREQRDRRRQQQDQDRKDSAAKQKAAEEQEAKDAARKKKEAAEAEAQAKKEKKNLKQAAKSEPKEIPSKSANATKSGSWSEDIVNEFAAECEALVADAKANIEARIEESTAMLTEAELSSVQPAKCLLRPLMQKCRGMEDSDVIDTVQKFAPLFEHLCEQSNKHRFKVDLLCEAQRVAHQMGLPRLSPASALLEVFFDGLYQAEVVEEQYFHMWAVADDETPGKTSAMFQVNPFLDFLRDGKFEGEESSDEEDEEGESGDEDEDDDEEEEGSDIEANVPQRNF